MKLGLGGLALVLGTTRIGAAEPYPEAQPDRPINLLPCMTELVVDEQFQSSADKTLDDRTPDIGVLHGFGPVEVSAHLSEFASLRAAITTHSFPEDIEVFVAGNGYANDGLRLVQGTSAGHKFHLAPGSLALVAGLGVTANEDRFRDATNELVWSRTFSGGANVRVEFQAARHLWLFAGPSAGVVLAHSDPISRRAALSVGGGAFVMLGRWEIFTDVGLADVTKQHLLGLSVGFLKRWGR